MHHVMRRRSDREASLPALYLGCRTPLAQHYGCVTVDGPSHGCDGSIVRRVAHHNGVWIVSRRRVDHRIRLSYAGFDSEVEQFILVQG